MMVSASDLKSTVAWNSAWVPTTTSASPRRVASSRACRSPAASRPVIAITSMPSGVSHSEKFS